MRCDQSIQCVAPRLWRPVDCSAMSPGASLAASVRGFGSFLIQILICSRAHHEAERGADAS
jgi:hypothetical protein